MSDELRDIIAKVSSEHVLMAHRCGRCGGPSWQCGGDECFGKVIGTWEEEFHEHVADHVLAKLKASSWAIVKLPERVDGSWPIDLDDDDLRVSRVYLVDQGTGEGLTGSRVTWGSLELNLKPAHTHGLATALLAANAADTADGA